MERVKLLYEVHPSPPFSRPQKARHDAVRLHNQRCNLLPPPPPRRAAYPFQLPDSIFTKSLTIPYQSDRFISGSGFYLLRPRALRISPQSSRTTRIDLLLAQYLRISWDLFRFIGISWDLFRFLGISCLLGRWYCFQFIEY